MKIFTLKKGQKISYQTFIEEVMGPEFAMSLPYNHATGISDHSNDIRKDDAYFEFDADYEIHIIKKRE